MLGFMFQDTIGPPTADATTMMTAATNTYLETTSA